MDPWAMGGLSVASICSRRSIGRGASEAPARTAAGRRLPHKSRQEAPRVSQKEARSGDTAMGGGRRHAEGGSGAQCLQGGRRVEQTCHGGCSVPIHGVFRHLRPPWRQAGQGAIFRPDGGGACMKGQHWGVRGEGSNQPRGRNTGAVLSPFKGGEARPDF